MICRRHTTQHKECEIKIQLICNCIEIMCSYLIYCDEVAFERLFIDDRCWRDYDGFPRIDEVIVERGRVLFV